MSDNVENMKNFLKKKREIRERFKPVEISPEIEEGEQPQQRVPLCREHFVPPSMTPRIPITRESKVYALHHMHIPKRLANESLSLSMTPESEDAKQFSVFCPINRVNGVIRDFPLTFWSRRFKYRPEEILSKLAFVLSPYKADLPFFAPIVTNIRLFPTHFHMQGRDLHFFAEFRGFFPMLAEMVDGYAGISFSLDSSCFEDFFSYGVAVDLWFPFEASESISPHVNG